jgi:alanyl-tRNA synthetase
MIMLKSIIMNSMKIRQDYLNFFAKQGHKIVASDSLIPSGDPTLLFTSAGMVQFKKHFLGQSNDTFTRATTCQKCFRTSDIDQVGKTNRHLTFFEMLGNFSFGDYFKKEAIAWAWDFLTNYMQLPKDKLYITIYKNDDEAGEIWKKIVPESMIYRLGDETNFWNMGPTGPCGPCSEILLDLGPDMGCGKADCSPACSCNRYLEIWNLVFTQFDRQENGELKNLPRKNIDTGMGLERLVAAANGKTNVFETDLFVPLVNKIADICSVNPDSKNISALRMMADHARAITFLVADGILPSNEGRGYVLRRILRRALRQGKLFGVKEPFLYKVTADVADVMKTGYPELMERCESIASIAKMEEEKFLETLESGTRMLEEIINKYKSTEVVKGKEVYATKFVIPGDDVFRLYDTYGFPPDLTREIAKEQGLAIDEEGFSNAQKQAQEKSRAAWSGSGEKDRTFYAQRHKEFGDTLFKGYTELCISTKVVAIFKNNVSVTKLAADETGEIVLAETPFYAEMGGQVADTGTVTAGDEVCAEVTDVQKPAGGLIVHTVKVIRGEITIDQCIEASVNKERRFAIMRHHTATHILHQALRQVLGNHVSQAGSLVTPDNFRFDFTHLAALKPEEIKSVEHIVNKVILSNIPVRIADMRIEEAKRRGAMALFGEKYGEMVRTVTIQDVNMPAFSMELCGGTHAFRTGDIGLFKITAESSVAAGTRRIEAVVGEAAENLVDKMDSQLKDIAEKLKAPRAELSARIDKLMLQQKELEREISKLKSQLASGGTADMMKNVREINGVKLLTGKLSDVDVKSLREITDNLKTKIGSGIVILAAVEKDKVSFVVSLTPDTVTAGYNAGKIAKNLAVLIEGSGGGKPDFAGTCPLHLETAEFPE